jgi:hypothetical protein
MYDYSPFSGFGVIDPPRAIGSVFRSDPVMMPVSTMQLPTAIISPVVAETGGAPTVVTSTPGASVGDTVVTTVAPVATTETCFAPISAWLSPTGYECWGPLGMWEWMLLGGFALWALAPKGR